MTTTVQKLPESIIKHFTIRMLGKAFSEAVMEDGRLVIKQGYIYKGVKYYEREVPVRNSP